jgi:hypothetical protein
MITLVIIVYKKECYETHIWTFVGIISILR